MVDLNSSTPTLTVSTASPAFHASVDTEKRSLDAPDQLGTTKASISGDHNMEMDTSKAASFSLDHDVTAEGQSSTLEYPEGGLRAWLCVFGGFWSTFITFGYMNAFGVFERYYLTNTLSSYSSSTIAWIGAVQYFLLFAVGGVAGRLFDLGYFRPLFTAGCVIVVFSQMMLSLCTEYYQIFLAQGIGLGIGFGLVFNLAVTAPTHHFNKRRGIAMGVMASGSSTGGTIYPIMIQHLIPRVGYGWTMRIVGFLALVCCVMAWLTLTTRIPPAIDVHDKSKGGWKQVKWMDFTAFKVPSYSCFVAGATLVMFGLYTPFTYMDVFSEYFNVPLNGYYLSILNAASCFGRVLPGFLADREGRINTVLPHLFVSAVLLFIYPLCTSVGGLVTFAIIYGFTSGCYVSLIPACVAQLGTTETVGTRIGMMFLAMSIGGLVGTPISGAILGTGDLNWWGTYIFSGAMVMGGVILIGMSRYFALGKALGGKI